MNWPFEDLPNVAVFTTRAVVEQEAWIQYVSHDKDDGAWQFHDNLAHAAIEEDVKVVSLKNIYQKDPTIGELADLPIGWCAWRESPKSPWKKYQKA
jgi:hypothetical protein